jgi:tRNA-2-methylthio-N6-dimethylallyladenosine synthase
MNISDSERLESALQSVGYVPANEPGSASFVVLNSCSVRASAEERILGKLGDLQRVKRTPRHEGGLVGVHGWSQQ